MTSGGSRLTELSALTVIPQGRPSAWAVTTVTPVAKWPITLRNVVRVSSIAGSVGERPSTVLMRGGRPGPRLHSAHDERRRREGVPVHSRRTQLDGRAGRPGRRPVRSDDAARGHELPD